MTMKQTILVIDDDPKLTSLLQEYLSGFGFNLVTVNHPVEGLDLLEKVKPDLVILDVMMPDMDGFALLREIRKNWNMPVIMLTARGEVTDRIVGLELGADDYLPKPFEPRELAARVQSILRRSTDKVTSTRLHFGPLTVDLERHAVSLDGKAVELTTMEFEMLTLFVKNEGKVLVRDQIMDRLRGFEWEAFDRSMDVLLSRLRHKLGDDPKKPRFIRTIWGKGYQFIGGEDEEEQM